jgi:hypothetical protein
VTQFAEISISMSGIDDWKVLKKRKSLKGTRFADEWVGLGDEDPPTGPIISPH